MIEKNKLIEGIKSFLGEDGINYLQEMKNEDKFYLTWGSFLYGNIGMQTRNYLIDTHPNILEQFNEYGEFEDMVTEITLSLLK